MKHYSKIGFLHFVMAGIFSLFLFAACSSGVSSSSDGGSTSTSKVTITFVDESGNVLDTQEVYNYDYGPASVTFTYSKKGYICTFFDSTGKEVKSGLFTTTKDCKITVKFTPIKYKIKFARSRYEWRSVTGSFPEEITCVYDKEYELPENDLTCESSATMYKARGWTTNESDYNKKGEYKSGQKVKNLCSNDDSTFVLYPCFTNDDAYLLKFYTSDSDYSSGYISIYADKDEILSASQIPAASKKGYNFAGYYLYGDPEKKVIDFSTYIVTGEASFKPKFTLGTYTATFVTEHGTAPEPVTWTYSESSYDSDVCDLTTGSYVLTATGYNFDGWKDDSGYGKYTIDAHDDAEDLTLTAKWTPWTGYVEYDKNAPSGVNVQGRINSFKDTFYYDTAKKLTKSDFYANGYAFIGWNTKRDGSGSSYADEATFIWKGNVEKETVVLYAQWEKLQTSITVSVLSPSADPDSDIDLTYDASKKCFKAELSGATSFVWYIDGSVVPNETGATLSIYAFTPGVHSVMVTTEFDGKTYGVTLAVNVTQAE